MLDIDIALAALVRLEPCLMIRTLPVRVEQAWEQVLPFRAGQRRPACNRDSALAGTEGNHVRDYCIEPRCYELAEVDARQSFVAKTPVDVASASMAPAFVVAWPDALSRIADHSRCIVPNHGQSLSRI